MSQVSLSFIYVIHGKSKKTIDFILTKLLNDDFVTLGGMTLRQTFQIAFESSEMIMNSLTLHYVVTMELIDFKLIKLS